MSLGDPFTFFPGECVSLILQYLPPVDVVRCERVSRPWKNFLRMWIASIGLRNHFPDAVEAGTNIETPTATHTYKKLAGRERNITLAQPTAICQERANHFAVAGNYAAWDTYDGFFWRHLSTQPDGTFGPVQQLKIDHDIDMIQVDSLCLNADGYLLIQVNTKGFNGFWYFFIHLESGKELWRRIPASTGEGSTLENPLIMRKERLYQVHRYDGFEEVASYSIQTGERLWTSQKLKCLLYGHMPPLIVRAAGAECIVFLQGWLDYEIDELVYGVVILNCATGDVHQQFTCPMLGGVYLCYQPHGRSEFAVVSQETAGDSLRKIQRFTQDRDGKFSVTRTEILQVTERTPWDPTDSTILIDPVKCRVSTGQPTALIKSAPLAEQLDADRRRAALESLQKLEPGTVVDQLFTPGEPVELNLRHIQNPDIRQSLHEDAEIRKMQFVDGQRVLITMDTEGMDSRFNLYDFTPRLPEV